MMIQHVERLQFHKDRGFAATAMRTREIINVRDPMRDPRFHFVFDQKFAFQTKAVLCLPICLKDQVLGVFQLFNKRRQEGEFFTKMDEEILKLFSDYCVLILQFTYFNEKVKKNVRIALSTLTSRNKN